ncbi:MAG: TIR domain-containing protein [Acidimicrobiia bacterium]
MATSQQAETEPRTGQVRFDGFISYSHTADELLAPRLQAALQTFAKPWWKRRALRVFRDQSSLSANPHLWSSITAALDASDWFVLLTSPEAAASAWVDREVAYWREQKDPERIIPVLTDGTLTWDDASGRLAPNSSVPPSLLDAFTGEPRWVDLRWAEEETQLDLRNGRFREVVADIASSLRGIPKDDLESEEVRQHRRTRRTAWGAGIALAVLAVAAITGAVIAFDQREQAEAQRILAEAETIRAEEETVRAESAESLARSRELAASAINILDDNPELSILLGLEAIESTPPGTEQPVEAINALREATHASRLRGREAASPSGGFLALDLSSDGTRLATVAQRDAKVTVTDVATGREISSYTDSTTVDHLFSLSFSADGEVLAVGVVDSARQAFHPGMPPRPGSEIPDDLPPRVIILGVESGEVLRTIDYPSCVEAVPLPGFSPDGAWLAVAGLSGPDCRTDQWAVELLDVVTFESVHRWETTAETALTWTADGSRFSVASDTSSSNSATTVFEVATGEIVLQYPADRGIPSPDGQRLVVDGGLGLGGLDVIEVATGTRTDILTGFDLLVTTKAFTADSSRLIVGTAGQEVLVFDLESGEQVHRLSPTGIPLSFDCLAQCETLLHSNGEGEVLTWDLSTTAGGELNSVDTGYFVNAGSLAATGDTGVFLGFSTLRIHPDVVPFDRASGQISTDRRPTETNSPLPLPDGRILLLEVSEDTPEAGPVVAWDPANDNVEEVAGCWTTLEALERSGFGSTAIPCADREGDYFFIDGASLSPDESSLLITDRGKVKIFDARTLEEQAVPALPAGHRTVMAYGGSWLVSSDGQVAKVVDLSDGRVMATLPTGSPNSWSDVSARGDLVAIFEWNPGELTVYDTGTWQPITSFTPGQSRGISFSPDGSKILTAQTDGYVAIWDTQAGTELFRIPLPGASGGVWLDEAHIVIGSATGLWTTITLDLEELKDLAVSRLTRGFTAEECETYRIDPCPGLETIKSR